MSFLILLLHRLNHFIVMSQGIDVVFLWVVFSRCLKVLKPWLLSYHIALLLWVDAHIFCSILILYWLPQTHKWTRYWLSQCYKLKLSSYHFYLLLFKHSSTFCSLSVFKEFYKNTCNKINWIKRYSANVVL